MVAEALSEDVDATRMLGALVDPDLDPDGIEWCAASSGSVSVVSLQRIPSTNDPSWPIRQLVSRPYCEPSSFHQRGV